MSSLQQMRTSAELMRQQQQLFPIALRTQQLQQEQTQQALEQQKIQTELAKQDFENKERFRNQLFPVDNLITELNINPEAANLILQNLPDDLKRTDASGRVFVTGGAIRDYLPQKMSSDLNLRRVVANYNINHWSSQIQQLQAERDKLIESAKSPKYATNPKQQEAIKKQIQYIDDQINRLNGRIEIAAMDMRSVEQIIKDTQERKMEEMRAAANLESIRVKTEGEKEILRLQEELIREREKATGRKVISSKIVTDEDGNNFAVLIFDKGEPETHRLGIKSNTGMFPQINKPADMVFWGGKLQPVK